MELKIDFYQFYKIKQTAFIEKKEREYDRNKEKYKGQTSGAMNIACIKLNRLCM